LLQLHGALHRVGQAHGLLIGELLVGELLHDRIGVRRAWGGTAAGQQSKEAHKPEPRCRTPRQHC
jgi:hypothetical protein